MVRAKGEAVYDSDTEFKKWLNSFANHVEPVCKAMVTAIHTTTLDVFIGKQTNPADDIRKGTGMSLRDVPVIVPITDPMTSLNISVGDTVFVCFVGGDVHGAHVIGRLWTGLSS